jgi:type I restriction enzyme, S subunit
MKQLQTQKTKFKDSGVQWIGQIPEGWEVYKLKYLLSTLESGKRESDDQAPLSQGAFSLGGEHINWDGTLKLDNERFLSYDFYASMNKGKIRIGDVLLVKDGATIGKTSIIKELSYNKMAVNEHVFLMRPNEKINSKLLYYLICSDSGFKQIKLTETGSAQGGINTTFADCVLCAISTSNDFQSQIASFLDRKTSEINTLIEKDKKLIELLKEKRVALINHVVTKGLNPKAKLKDSGIEWIGKIPEGWETRKLKQIANIKISNVDKKIKHNEPEILLCNYIHVYKNNYITSKINFMKNTCSLDQRNNFKIKKNDVIITKDSETAEDIAVPSLVKDDFRNVICGYHLALIRPKKKIVFGEYLFRLFQSKKINDQFYVAANGVTRFGISTYPILNSYFPLPPLLEQFAISSYLDKETSKIDKTIQKIEKKIELLEEYKKSLIHHVVTGKVDVRGS